MIDWGNCSQIISNGYCINRKLDCFNIPCGISFQLYLFYWTIVVQSRYWENKPILLMYGVLWEKQSFKSIIIIGHDLRHKEGKESLGCKRSIGWITLFTPLKSMVILHFPDFFFSQQTKAITWAGRFFYILCLQMLLFQLFKCL